MGKRSRITVLNMKLRKKRQLRTTVFDYSSEEEVILNNSVDEAVVNTEEQGENSNKYSLNKS